MFGRLRDVKVGSLAVRFQMRKVQSGSNDNRIAIPASMIRIFNEGSALARAPAITLPAAPPTVSSFFVGLPPQMMLSTSSGVLLVETMSIDGTNAGISLIRRPQFSRESGACVIFGPLSRSITARTSKFNNRYSNDTLRLDRPT